MPSKLTEPEVVLRALLANGLRCSREVLAEMAVRGISAKQVRTAREKQGIVVHRSGSGTNMRTTWAPPPGGFIHAHPVRSSTRTPAREPLADRHYLDPTSPERGSTVDVHRVAIFGAAATIATTKPPTEQEVARRVARMRAFIDRGVPQDKAKRTAILLMHADRENRHAYGSCAQCQLWTSRACQKIRPVIEIHVCWQRRTLGA